MNRIEEKVRFTCPACRSRLRFPATAAGLRCRCPQCKTTLKVPARLPVPMVREVVYPVADPPPVVLLAQQEPVEPPPVVVLAQRQESATVPLKLGLPKNLGSMETTVTQGTADGMAKAVTGGLLVALGVAVAAFFGIRTPSA